MSNKDDLFLFTDILDEEPSGRDIPDAEAVPTDVQSVVEEAPVIETTPIEEDVVAVPTDNGVSDPLSEEFHIPDGKQTVIEPSFTGTADALTAAPKARVAPVADELDDEVALTTAAPEDTAPAEEEEGAVPAKRHPFMRFLGAIVPHIGDTVFDVVRKCIMLVGILVFVGAATYLIDDLVLIPIHNDVLVESLQQLYSPDTEPSLSEDEQNFKYPQDIDPAFKKLYYQNNDVRGWISYKTTDKVTFNIDYPIVQSTDNDYYLFHDFNRTYNKNGTLFYDYRNDFSSKKSTNRNTVIYGHNMASGQMLAGLNKLLWSVDYARVAPTFTMNTIYNQAEYKVFALMLLNNSEVDGIPFAYLRTDFHDNVEFAGFLSEIMARSLYVYGDVDVRPDDEIVMLSTCTDWDLAHFKDGRTVVVARKVRAGEKTETDVSQITYNDDVIMPYAWYINQKKEPHPYYTDPQYIIQPLDTLMEYLATSTAPEGQETTALTFYQDGTFGTVPTTAITDVNGNIITTVQNTKPYVITVSVESTPVYYSLGSGFDYDNTRIIALYSDGQKKALNPRVCAVTGFDSSKVGSCNVTMHYGALNVSFTVNIVEGAVAPLNPTTTTTVSTTVTTTVTTTQTTTTVKTTTTRRSNFKPFGTTTPTDETTTTVTTTSETEAETTTSPTESSETNMTTF